MRARRAIALLGVLALALGAFGCAKPAAQEPLSASLPAEQTLRALRLVGVDHAAVGEEAGTVTLRIEVPAISSAGDVEIAWQAGVGVLGESYPRARRYVVRLASADGQPLVEFEVRGREARALLGRKDAAGLRKAAVVRYLTGGESAMPDGALAIGGGVSAAYLDAKNRAALGLLEVADRPTFARLGRTAASKSRAAVPGRPAPTADEDAGAVLASVLREVLSRTAADPIEGVDGLRARAASTSAAGPERVLALRRWIAVAEATTAQQPFGDGTGAAALTARWVRSARLAKPGAFRDGRLADGILVALRSPEAPAEMRSTVRFLRGKRYDIDPRARVAEATPAAPEPILIDAQAAAVHAFADRLAFDSRGDGGAPVVSWETSAGVRSVAPQLWLAYVRGDGRAFWLLGEEGPAALTDSSLNGWAWSDRRVDVVDSSDVSRVLSTIELR